MQDLFEAANGVSITFERMKFSANQKETNLSGGEYNSRNFESGRRMSLKEY